VTAPEGLLVVDKPAGPTSHDIVSEVRRFARGARVGHTGTLDPFATGVLALCIGRATRLARFLSATRKRYDGCMKLGVSTDTYDREGRIVSERGYDGIDDLAVRRAAAGFTGRLMQTPPAYSARKHKGRPLHRLAREGVAVPLTPTPVEIYRLEILSVDGPLVRFEVETSPGTYVRSLAHDLGETLGCGAHLVELRRVASGSLDLAHARSLEEVLAHGRSGTLADIVIGLSEIDLGLPSVIANQEGRKAMLAGRPLSAGDLSGAPIPRATGDDGPPAVRVQDEAGELLGVAIAAIGTRGEPTLRPDVVLAA